MELSAWDLAGVAVKALLYAATFCAAGGVFFERYTASLLSILHQRRVRRWVGLCVGIAVVTTGRFTTVGNDILVSPACMRRIRIFVMPSGTIAIVQPARTGAVVVVPVLSIP